MNCAQGIKFMQDLCAGGASGELVPETTLPELKLFYPGYKNVGDYRLELNGDPPTHADICQCLYERVCAGVYDFVEIKSLLEDVYQNGTDLDYDKYAIPNVVKLTALLFWITLQDEINFPSPRFQGRRMPFSRYFEAIYCASENCNFTIEDVLSRCDNRGYRPAPYRVNSPPEFYY